MRSTPSAIVLAMVAVFIAVVAAQAGARTSATPTVPCEDIVGQAKTGRAAGYRVVLGIVSVPPAHLVGVVKTDLTPLAYWRKAGLVIRASHIRVTVSIPKEWRMRAAITWGSSGNVSTLKFVPCPTPTKLWNGYAGGFYIRASHACVPLMFTVGRRSQTVRFGIGSTCPAR
jgi:hypothetical protein